jgi:hypothetical protein
LAGIPLGLAAGAFALRAGKDPALAWIGLALTIAAGALIFV